MKGNNLRLRLVVRRNTLPEVRLLFPISLDEEPTIANLLEQVNDTIPLESTDWSLDDYVAEVQDSHGHSFECLHFQRVDSVLDKDEELIIRPLFTVDRKKRLLSGREQISADGRHLVDGVPFGRPRLRVLQGRPPVDIPPLKRRRIMVADGEDELSATGYNQQDYEEDEDDEDDEDEDGDYDDDEDYTDPEDQPLRLTEHGEQQADPERLQRSEFGRASSASLREVESMGDHKFPTEHARSKEAIRRGDRRHVRFSDVSIDEEEEVDELDGTEPTDKAAVRKGKKRSARHCNIGSAAKALSGNIPEEVGHLDHQDQATAEANYDKGANDGIESNYGEFDDEGDDDESVELNEAELQEELRALQRENTTLDQSTGDSQGRYESRSLKRRDKPSTKVKEGSDLSVLDKISSLRAAFPTAQFELCEKALRSSDMNEREAYWKLRKSNQPTMTADQLRQHLDMLSLSTTDQPSSANNTPPFCSSRQENDGGGESEAESVDSIVKYHDTHGFPPGSLLDGTASRLAAEALRESGVDVKIPVHVRFGEEDDGDCDTRATAVGSATRQVPANEHSSDSEEEDSSSSSLSSSSSTDSDESDAEDSDEDEDEGDDDDSKNDTDSDDSGPEVASSRQREASLGDRTEDGGSQLSSDSSDANVGFAVDDGGLGTKRRPPAVVKKANSLRSSSSSEGDNSSDSSSDTSSSGDESNKKHAEIARNPAVLPGTEFRPHDTASTPATHPQPGIQSKPGSGSSKTRARNQRRRAAKQAKKAAEAAARSGANAQTVITSIGTVTSDPPSNSAEIRERKKALLQKLASQEHDSELPAVPVSRDVDITVCDSPASVPEPTGLQHQGPDASHIPGGDSAEAPTASASSTSGRPTLDVGAGRRMLFASLGLRNPKTKADKDKIRAGLMKGVNPLVNPRLGPADSATRESSMPHQTPRQEQGHEQTGDDPEAWREKIRYRAVECCQEGVVLSEPPFPFVQRWDPQQQYLTHKRGKRKRRHQEHHYEEYYNDPVDDKPHHKKQKQGYHDDAETSFMSDADTTGYGYEENVTLDYDDDPDAPVEAPENRTADNNTSQLTDADDLPTLPSDLSRLPMLQLGKAKPGMVITWKQMLVSKATGWAPQVVDLTAVIVQPADETDALRLVLAKRDRHLDGNEKTFDSEGNRVYDRFEAPDTDDETSGETVDGYRTVYYSDMMEPRILQEPIMSAHTTTLTSVDESQVKTTDNGHTEQSVDDNAFLEVRRITNTMVEHESAYVCRDKGEPDEGETQRSKPRSANADANDSVIPETVLEEHSERIQSLDTEQSAFHVEGVSITEDQRRDISLIMHDAGFQDEIDPVVAEGPHFSLEDLSSPSRQLDEEMSEAAVTASHKKPRSSGRTLSIQSDASSLHNRALANKERQHSLVIANDNESVHDSHRDVTPTVGYPQLPVPSSASSAHSGRQPDPRFSRDWSHDGILQPVDETGDEAMHDSRGQQEDDSVEVDMTPTKRTLTSQDTDGSFSLESSPLPSLGEIYSSARSSQGPVRPVFPAGAEAHKSEGRQDLEYEEAMRLVDEGADVDDGEGWSEHNSQSKRELSTKASRALAASKTATSSQGSKQRSSCRILKVEPRDEAGQSSIIAPMASTRSSKTSATRSFVVPEDAQVLSLVTSSPEPELQENYAEDSIDSTYEDHAPEDAGLFSGSGWVKKVEPPRKERTRRGASVSVLPSDKRRTADNKWPAASQGPSSKTVVGSKSGKIKRKTWART